MKELNIKPETIREYLLGRVSDEKTLGEIEDLLFTDDEFCSQAELIEDEIINDYAFGRLSDIDTKSFEEILKLNPELKLKLKLTQSLKFKSKVETIPASEEKKAGFFDSLRAFFRQPLYAGAFGVLLILVLGSMVYFLIPSESKELAGLKEIYKTERPTQTRVSKFDYAPFFKERGEETNNKNKNKLRLIETKLLEALESDPSAENRHALGVFYLTQKKYEDSLRELEKATRLDEKNAEFRNDLGSAYFELAKSGKQEKRLENLTRANEEFSKSFELNKDQLEALFNKSLVLEELNLPRRAKESWEEYLQKDSTSKWAEEARKRLQNLNQKENTGKTKEQVLEGFLEAYREGNFQKALQIHNETKGTLKDVSIPFLLTNRFLIAKKEPDQEKARESLEALKYIGGVEKNKHSDFFVSELTRLYSNINERQVEGFLNAQNLLIEGFGLIKKSKYEESIEKFEQSKKQFLANGNPIEANVAEIWAGQMLPDIGKIEESRIRLKNLIALAEKRKFKIFIPTAYYWVGVGDFRQKKFSQSNKNSKKAFEMAEQTENLFEVQHSAEAIAHVYEYLGELRSSLNFLGKANVNRQAFYANPAQTSRELWNLADLNGKLGHNSTAIDFARESLVLSQNVLPETEAVNDSFRSLTNALKRKKNFKEALKYAVESNQIARQREPSPETDKVLADTYLLLADLKREMQNCAEALPDYVKSEEFYSQTPEINFNLYRVFKGKLLCFRELNRQTEFQIELQKLLALSEQYRRNIREDETRQAFFENEQIVFDAAISDALEQTDGSKAFQFAELSKSRSLLDFIRSDKSISEIQAKDSAVTKPLRIEEIQNRMPENVQIVQYSMLAGKLVIWTLSKSQFDFAEKEISNAELEQKIKIYRQSIIEKENGPELKQTARELYKLLIPDDLEKDKVICFIPDKSLHQIPFASLISPNEKYLIEDFAIFYSPSASVFVIATENAEKKSGAKEERLLSFGNPHFDREENPNLEDLPNAEIEAETILVNYQMSDKFIGQKATKKNFLNQFEKAEIIHFAGHFVANGQTPRNSKFIFTDENLHSFELADKKLPDSKLVILSACETAFESFNKSEGTIGIGRTFLALGTPLVIASGWKVDSESTKDLMISFHQKRRQKGFSSIEAMRRAQLEILKKPNTEMPFFWAAFSTIGGFSNY